MLGGVGNVLGAAYGAGVVVAFVGSGNVAVGGVGVVVAVSVSVVVVIVTVFAGNVLGANDSGGGVVGNVVGDFFAGIVVGNIFGACGWAKVFAAAGAAPLRHLGVDGVEGVELLYPNLLLFPLLFRLFLLPDLTDSAKTTVFSLFKDLRTIDVMFFTTT